MKEQSASCPEEREISVFDAEGPCEDYLAQGHSLGPVSPRPSGTISQLHFAQVQCPEDLKKLSLLLRQQRDREPAVLHWRVQKDAVLSTNPRRRPMLDKWRTAEGIGRHPHDMSMQPLRGMRSGYIFC